MLNKTFIIAEAGINHMGNLSRAKSLVEAAKEAGADAIKFQTYTTEKRTYAGSPIWNILKQCELAYDQQLLVKEHADSVGIEFFSTPFDLDALKFLVEELNVRIVKIASMDITNLSFLKAVASYGPKSYNYSVILSTGMSNPLEIGNALECLRPISYLTLLHCKSSYPLKETDANLRAIAKLKEICNGFAPTVIKVGYSDHTSGITVPSLAVVAGATVIEKHFTLNTKDDAVDNAVSIDPASFKLMVGNIRMYEEILGTGELKLDACEEGIKQFRRVS